MYVLVQYVCLLTICMHSYYEVVSHTLGLPQLVRVAIMHHVITLGKERNTIYLQ